MGSNISKYYWFVANFIYDKIFHEKMSNEFIKFSSNLSYVGLGTFIATFFSFIFNMLSGRLLGPIEYGEFNLVQSVAMFLYIPMLMGSNTSMVKYNTEENNFSRQQKIISTTYILVFIQIFASILLYILFKTQIIKIFSISSEILNLSIIYSIVFVLYTLGTETLRSLHDIKKYSTLIPLFSIILLLSLLYFLHINLKSSMSMIFSMYIAYGITGLVTLPSIRRYLKFNFDKKCITKLTKYSNYAIIGGLSYSLYTNVDSILINKYMQIEYVGLYKAYIYSFTSVIILLAGIFSAVFFPYASSCKTKKILLNRINKSILYLILILFPITIVTGLIIFKIYGDKYIFDPKLALLSGLTGVCISVQTIYGNLMNSIGVNGIKITSFAAIIMALVNIPLNIIFIPVIGVEGAMMAIVVSYCISILIMLSKRKLIV